MVTLSSRPQCAKKIQRGQGYRPVSLKVSRLPAKWNESTEVLYRIYSIIWDIKIR